MFDAIREEFGTALNYFMMFMKGFGRQMPSAFF